MSDTMYQMNITTGPVETPEPRIGPGMILERGNTRVLLAYQKDDEAFYTGYVYRKRRWFGWPMQQDDQIEIEPTEIPVMLLSGFRVIREADPTHPKGE